MSSLDLLLRDVLKTPTSDIPRLAYADAIASTDPDRSDFIRTQLRLVHSWNNPQIPDHEQLRLYDRSNQLVEQFGSKWAGEVAQYAHGWEYRRGFMELIKIDAKRLLDHAERLFELAPIEHVDLTAAAAHMQSLSKCQWLARLKSLGLGRNELTDADAAALAGSRFAKGLRWLDLSLNRIDRVGAEAVCASPNLSSLRYLAFHGNLVDPTDRIGAVDSLDGSVREIEHSRLGAELEASYGPKPFLHIDPIAVLDYPPDRFR